MIAGLLLLPASCELDTQGARDAPVVDASSDGTSGGAGRLDAARDREGLDGTLDPDGGNDEDASDAATDATHDSARVCGVDPLPPGGPVCPPECGGCPENKCRLTCTTALSCQNKLVRCPPGFDCEVTCAGPGSCVGALFVCEPTQRCGVICEGVDACHDATVQCGDGSCGLLCVGGSCSATTLNCGSGDCLSLCLLPPYPRVNCFGSCKCTPC